jgi:hypothetical protein
VTQLLEHERIQTTLPKAKELRKVADRVVTYAKKVRITCLLYTWLGPGGSCCCLTSCTVHKQP